MVFSLRFYAKFTTFFEDFRSSWKLPQILETQVDISPGRHSDAFRVLAEQCEDESDNI